MWGPFFFENLHFAVNFFAALVFFAMFWLYFDAWLERKEWNQVPKLLGILSLSLSFVIHATQLETGVLTASFFNTTWLSTAFLSTRLGGYILLILGGIIDPLQPAPKTKGLSKVSGVTLLPLLQLLPLAAPILSAVVFWFYLRRATIGLERHLRTVTVAFCILTIAEVVAQANLFIDTSSVTLYQLVAPFGVIWIVQHCVILLAVTVLGQWVWQYLTKRLEPQLFMIFTTTILGIFLLTTTIFTALLLQNMQKETLTRLETDVKVLRYGIESRKLEILSDSQVMAQRAEIIESVSKKDKVSLVRQVQQFLQSKNISSLIVVDSDGQVLARGEDTEQIGDSISSNALVQRGLLGEEKTSVVVSDGGVHPVVSVRAVAPIRFEGKTVGAVLTGITIDTAFVDGIKEATGLEAAVYGQDILVATTQLSTEKKSRLIGIKEQNPTIRKKVLEHGEPYSGSLQILNTPYFVSFLPLKDMDDVVVGMLFVGRPQITVLATASRSIEVTFMVTAALIIVSIVPAYFIARFIANQLA